MIFKTTISLNQYAPIATTTNFISLRQLVANVEEDNLIPVIGEALYDKINVDDETSLTDSLKKLLDKARALVAPMVAYQFTSLTEVKLSDAGAQRTATNNFQSAYQNQVVNFKQQNLTDSIKATERLYKFLEKNIEDYPDWTDSDEFKNYRSLFIKTGGEFDNNFRTASPYTNFYALRNFMADVEQSVIKKLLGADLFSALKATEANPDWQHTDAEKDLLISLKKAIAFLSVAAAIPFLDVRLDGNGFTVMNSAAGQNDALTKRSAAEADRMNNYIKACKTNAATYINNISEWLAENTSPLPEAPPPDNGNTDRSGAFGMF